MITLSDYDAVKAHKYKAPSWIKFFRVKYPEACQGKWSIKHFTVKMDLPLMRLMRDDRGTLPGKYTMLHHAQRGVIMSDTMAEAQDCYSAYYWAQGHVLIHGLGLGCILKAVLSKDSVKHVDVVEIDPDVIALIGPHYVKDPRVHIHQGNCLTYAWPRGSYWNVVWHDIWDNICSDNLKQMKELKRRFSRKCTWQECWAEDESQRLL